MDAPCVLVVDDDREIVKAIMLLLKNEGICSTGAHNGEEALTALSVRGDIRLIILDIMMPKLDGLSATMRIREKRNIPILLLSAKSEQSDKILGLSMGADDYVCKPFHPPELMARVKSLLRRYTLLGDVHAKNDGKTVTTGGLSYVFEERCLYLDGEPVKLTATETKLVELFMRNLGRVFPAEELCILLIFTALGNSNSFDGLIIAFILSVPLYILWSDLLVNKGNVFRHNSINTIRKTWRGFINKKPFQKGMLLEFNIFVSVETALVLFTVFFLLLAAGSNDEAWLILCLFTIPAGVFILWRFSRRYKRMVNDLGRLVDHVAEMNRGHFENELTVHEDAVLYAAAQSVNSIQDSFANALQKATKSERMKVDLITNVSHDLKTPLTSIIGYVELLSQMELPEEAVEHVKIIAQKSERLKLLIQDLFDLSKSTSGSMEMVFETIDLARLAEQTLSDSGGGGEFKIRLSDKPLWIHADGGKLSRALHNLIDNAKKYSLANTRVYVDTFRECERAVYEIKNIAGYEMDFNPDEITERFVRGDASRSAEGSGLGLSIAESFTVACGGSFKVIVDGDMFKVRISFASALPPEQHDLQAQQ